VVHNGNKFLKKVLRAGLKDPALSNKRQLKIIKEKANVF